MTSLLTMLLIAALLAMSGDRLLLGRAWVSSAPAVAVLAWLAMLAAGLVATAGTGVAAIVPLLRHLGGVRELVHRCPEFMVALHNHDGYLLLASVGVTLTVGLLVWLLLAVRRHMQALHADSQRHRLALVADGQGQRPVAVVAADRCAAWSVPAGSGYVVVTDSAVRLLTRCQLDAVVRHERAHLRGHHHLILTLVRALRSALPCALTRSAADEIAVLLEMRADDQATGAGSREVLRTALLKMATVPPTPATLAITGGSAHRRLQRLVNPLAPANWRAGAALTAAISAAAGVTGLLVATAATVVLLHECPLPT